MEDYLPRAEALDNPPPAKTANLKRTLFFWVVLILMVIAIYQVFSVPPKDTPRPPSDDGFAWGAFVLGLVALFLVFLWTQLRRGMQFTLSLEPGLLALADGQLDRAIELFGKVAQKYRTQLGFAAAARCNRAHALLRSGALQPAIDELIAIERTPGLVFASDVRVSTAVHLAEAFALRGDLERAQKWIEDARRRLAKAHSRTWAAALQRMVTIIIAARKGDLDEAAKIFDAAAPRLEAALSVSTMRTAWLMRAFVAAKLGGPRETGAEPWLSLLRGARADEIGYLSKEWPELGAFVEASGLLR